MLRISLGALMPSPAGEDAGGAVVVVTGGAVVVVVGHGGSVVVVVVVVDWGTVVVVVVVVVPGVVVVVVVVVGGAHGAAAPGADVVGATDVGATVVGVVATELVVPGALVVVVVLVEVVLVDVVVVDVVVVVVDVLVVVVVVVVGVVVVVPVVVVEPAPSTGSPVALAGTADQTNRAPSTMPVAIAVLVRTLSDAMVVSWGRCERRLLERCSDVPVGPRPSPRCPSLLHRHLQANPEPGFVAMTLPLRGGRVLALRRTRAHGRSARVHLGRS